LPIALKHSVSTSALTPRKKHSGRQSLAANDAASVDQIRNNDQEKRRLRRRRRENERTRE